MVVGFFECLVALVAVDHAFDPLLAFKQGKYAHAEHAILSAVVEGETYLFRRASADGIQVIRRTVVHLRLMIVNPTVVSQRVNERAAVPIGADYLSRELAAVGG